MKKKIKQFFIKNKLYLYTILSALFIVILVYILQDVAPFGKNSLLTIDFFHQYGPMLGEFYDRIKNHLNLIYSFNMAMGLPFFRNYFNYLSSPFNLILFLFNHDNLVMSYSVIIGLKTVVAAFSMVVFLKNKFKTESLYLIPLSLFYAYCAYFIAYYWNIMWLDGLVFLPLVVLGIENLINKNKPLLYIISLAVMLYANYFIAYMICIFSVIYFIGYLINQTEKFNLKTILKKVGLFGLSSLLAGGLCACFLFPMYKALTSISATSDTIPFSQYYDFTFKEFFFNHFSGVGSTVLNSGITTAPNISCGILAVALFILFIINPKIKLKTKIVYGLMLLILLSSFLLGLLDYIWHGFHVPNDLPFRYSFLYSFVMIIIAAYSLMNLKNLKFRWSIITYIIMLVLISFMKVVNYQNISNDMLILNYAVITIYFLIAVLYYYFPKYKKWIPLIFIITASLEITVWINNNWNILQYIKDFYSDYNSTEKALDYIKKNDQEMYRIEKTNTLTFNDPSWYNYYGQSTFSSMEYENMAVLEHNLGLPGNEINSYYYKQTTPIYDLMSNIKYFIGTNQDNINYEEIYSKDNITINKAKYNAGLMFGLNSNIKKWTYSYSNPFMIQNDFIAKGVGIENVLEKVNSNNKIVYNENGNTIVKYSVKNEKGNLYLYQNDSSIDFIIVNGILYYSVDNYSYTDNLGIFQISSHESYNEKYIININNTNDEFTYYVGYNNYNNDSVNVYKLNENKFKDAFQKIEEQKVQITDFEEYKIKGTINLKENLTMFTSIPYDEGWVVKVDGKEIQTYPIGNALLGFNIPKGNHTIELNYIIPGFKTGILISIVSLSGLIILIIICNKKRHSTI